MMEHVWDALYTGAGLFWKALWALASGYAVSACIQVFLSKQEAGLYLWEARPRQLALSMGLQGSVGRRVGRQGHLRISVIMWPY